MIRGLERSYTAATLVAALAFVALLTLGYDAIVRVRADDEALAQSRSLHAQLDDVQITMLDVERTQDSYLLTGDRSQLAAQREASDRLQERLTRIDELLSGHPEQAGHHAQLVALVARQREFLRRASEAPDAPTTTGPALAQQRFDEGRAIMDEIRLVLQRMRAEEEGGLDAQQARTRDSIARASRLGGAMAALTALLLVVSYLANRRERAAQRRALSSETAARQAAQDTAHAEARLAARAAAALDDSETRLRGVFESATDAILVADENQTIVMANPAAASIFRCPIDQLVGAPLERFIPERFRERHRRDVTRFGAGDAGARPMGTRPEVWALRAGGEEFPADASISHLRIGNQQQYMVILRDVTERLRAEAARRAQEHQLLGLFNVTSVGIAQADPVTRRLVRVNAAFCRITGFSEAELLAMTVNDLNHPDDRALDQAQYEALQCGSGTYDIEKRYVRKDGAVIWVHASGDVIRDGQGRPQLAFAVIEDITQRRAAEQALRASEARLRRLLIELPEPVAVHRDGRTTFANRAMQRLFGRDETDLIGHRPDEFVHPDDRPTLATRMAAVREATPGQMLVAPQGTRIVRPDGSERLTESTATRIDSGEHPEVLVFVRDVTELRHAQDDLARSHDELRRLVAAQEDVRENERKRIAREIHDDLQQTLAAIKIDLGAVAALVRSDPLGALATLAEADRLATEAVTATRRIVNDLRPRLLDDLGLVPALEMLLEHFAQRHGVKCRMEASDGEGGDLQAPAAVATCLYRITQEALQNVAKHAGASRVDVSLSEPRPGWLKLLIADDGGGFVEDDLRKPQSYGLIGMRERVRALGGRLDVRSPPEGGTAIEVELPLSVASQASAKD